MKSNYSYNIGSHWTKGMTVFGESLIMTISYANEVTDKAAGVRKKIRIANLLVDSILAQVMRNTNYPQRALKSGTGSLSSIASLAGLSLNCTMMNCSMHVQ